MSRKKATLQLGSVLLTYKYDSALDYPDNLEQGHICKRAELNCKQGQSQEKKPHYNLVQFCPLTDTTLLQIIPII
jgi:hypothetical protein